MVWCIIAWHNSFNGEIVISAISFFNFCIQSWRSTCFTLFTNRVIVIVDWVETLCSLGRDPLCLNLGREIQKPKKVNEQTSKSQLCTDSCPRGQGSTVRRIFCWRSLSVWRVVGTELIIHFCCVVYNDKCYVGKIAHIGHICDKLS